VRAIDDGNVEDTAQMVKLVDTPASGAGDRKVVEVRVFFWAPIQNSRSALSYPETRESGFLRYSPLILNEKLIYIFESGVYRSKSAPYSSLHQQRQRCLIMPRW
jgi:hypothetical protein